MESSVEELQLIAFESKELISTIIDRYQDSVNETAELIANEIFKDERMQMEKQIHFSNKTFLKNFNKTKINALKLFNSIREQARSKVQLLIEEKNREMATIVQKKEESYKREIENTKQRLRLKIIRSLWKKQISNHVSDLFSQPQLFPSDNTTDANPMSSISCPMFKANAPICQWCRITSYELFLCGGCHQVWYCDIMCQERDWDLHQLACCSENIETD